MEKRPGLYDPDDWYNRWQGLHQSEEFPGEFGRLILRHLGDPFEEGTGTETLRFSEGGGELEVEVKYLLEQFAGGRILHVLSILSPGDPLPPSAKGT